MLCDIIIDQWCPIGLPRQPHLWLEEYPNSHISILDAKFLLKRYKYAKHLGVN